MNRNGALIAADQATSLAAGLAMILINESDLLQ